MNSITRETFHNFYFSNTNLITGSYLIVYTGTTFISSVFSPDENLKQKTDLTDSKTHVVTEK